MFIWIALIILIILVLVSSVKVDINTFKENEDNKAIIKVILLYGLIKLKKELAFMEVTKKNKEIDGDIDEDLEVKIKSDSWSKYEGYTDFINIRKKIEEAINFLKNYKDVIDYSLDRTRFIILIWKTEIGFEDAALTGIATGFVNIFKSNLFAILNSSKRKPKKIHFKIIPDFKKQVFKTNIHCIFTMKLGYIIIVGLKYLWVKKSNVKLGKIEGGVSYE